MKLRNKTLLVIFLAWLLFLALVYIDSEVFVINRFPLLSLIVSSILFSVLMLLLIRFFVVHRLEHLVSEIASIKETNALHKRVYAQGRDEIATVGKEINKMLDIIHASHLHLENRVVRLAHYDTLTSLPNRIFFNEILNKTLQHAKRSSNKLAVMLVNLDRFKVINDAWGFQIGDKVLKEVALRLQSLLRAGDILAHFGSDDFVILLNDISSTKNAGTVAEKILKTCGESITIDGYEFFLSASIGICVFPDDGHSLEDLMKYADLALYKVKRAGGNNYQYYTEEMNTAAHKHIKLEASLRKAIQNNELTLYFQPQMLLRDGTINRVEALLRWEHPELGLISPGEFIPLAEETSLIMPIGEWALHEACRLAKSWQDGGFQAITVAVNVSPKQFRHQDVALIVKEALAHSKLQPACLEVEITETAVMDNVSETINKLKSIADMGVRISIDDFGTGYTSISYLKQFPVSILKIDQLFVKGIPQNPDDIAIIGAVIALAHNLELEVVAEGVETEEQMECLVKQGCDLIQGYFISSPLPAAKITQLFTNCTPP